MIILKLRNHCWIVDWSKSKDANYVKNLFGSCEIKSSFTDQNAEDDVLIEIQKRNPKETVQIEVIR